MSDCIKNAALAVLLGLAQSGCAATETVRPEPQAEQPAVETRKPPAREAGKPLPEARKLPPEPKARLSTAETGTATWYGPGLEGRQTASGETFDPQRLTAAHKTLPFGTRVRVTVLDTLASVVVTINDRLPDASRHVIDLSQAAGRMLKMIGEGIARVRIEILE